MVSELLYKDILGGDGDDAPKKTRFKILNNTDLHINYTIQNDGVCITDENTGLLEGMGTIEIIERDIPGNKGLFKGPAEPIMSGCLKFVRPSSGIKNLEGEDLKISPFGEWLCQRCQHINYIPVINGTVAEPFSCDNDVCGRKGPFVPQFPKDIIKPIWKLPLQPIPTCSTEIYTELYDFTKKYLVLNPDEYHILTLWIMASWLVDDFNTCPYLCMIAPKESGKTQVLKVLGELAYRSVATISVTAASLFRAIELWKITLLIDEAEFQVKTETEAGQALYGCLNGGYKRGSYAIRIEGDSSNRLPATYEVFGFKAIAATKLFHPTLESRSIVFNMKQGRPEKLLIDEKEGAILRSKLLFWRFATLNKLRLMQPESSSGRLIEMFSPLFTIAQIFKKTGGMKLPITYDEITALLNRKIKEMESRRKEEEKGSQEAQIIEAIVQLKDYCKSSLSYEKTGISVKEISEHLKENMGWEEKQGKSPITVIIGLKLKIMGINTLHKKHGNIIDLLDDETNTRLIELEKRYL